MNVLVIGGTRNIGHFLVHALVERGDHVVVLNRGLTRDELPASVERMRVDRTDKTALARALKDRSFDVVVDNALYKKEEAEEIVELLRRRVGHYIFLSSGQVYLVREGIARPFSERDYDGMLMPAPMLNTYAYEEWRYGMDKRAVEDVMRAAWGAHQFPYTALRLPMVIGERDHFGRLYAYILRVNDGGPILIPSTPNFPLRHIYSGDVVRAILRLADGEPGTGRAYNISQDETVTLDDYIARIAAILDVPAPQLMRVRRDLLEANGFIPDCSPFSERWMSELDNSLSKTELGMTYTPLDVYLERTVRHYIETAPPPPAGYKRRRAEILFAEQHEAQDAFAQRETD